MTEMAASAAASAAERFPPTANTCRPHTVLRAYRLTGGNSSETLLAGSSCGAYPTIDFAFGADVDTAVGSSRSRSRGRFNMARASRTFCWLPPLSVDIS
jgi:hypothetical protein